MTIINGEVDTNATNHDIRSHRRLWAAVLLVGLQDAASDFFKAQHMKRPHVAYESLRWIYSSRKGPSSFNWICDVLDMSPYHVREKWRMSLRKLVKTEV